MDLPKQSADWIQPAGCSLSIPVLDDFVELMKLLWGNEHILLEVILAKKRDIVESERNFVDDFWGKITSWK